MAVARFKLENGRIARFEVPDGSTPEQAQSLMQQAIQADPNIFGVTPPPTTTELAPGGAETAGAEALLAVGSGAIAQPVSGLAGLAGLVAGAVPGGESPAQKGARFQKATQEALTFKPRTEVGARLTEGIGQGAEFLTRQVRTPVAGIAGLLQAPFVGTERAAETIRATREEGIGKTAGRALADLGAPPIVSTIAETLPTAVATIAGTRFPKTTPKRPTDLPTIGREIDTNILTVPRPKDAPLTGEFIEGPSPIPARINAPIDITPPVSSANIVEFLQKGKTEKIAAQVVPDVAVVESAQRLGVDLNPEHYSTSTAFQDVARALKSKPGSQLQASEVKAIQTVAKRADELVLEIAKSLDKSAVSDSILKSTRSTIDDLETKADFAFKRVRKEIPERTLVNTDNLQQFLDRRLRKFNGDEARLTTAEKGLQKAISRTEGKSVTYAALDQIRRDVGSGFNKREGPFRNDDDGDLRVLYGRLAETQQGVADAFSKGGGAIDVGALYRHANDLIIKRKGVEDAAVSLFGRNASGSLVPNIRASATGIPKGDVTEFNKLMGALKKPRREEVAAQVLNDLFAGGSRQGGELGTGFAKTWRSLNRNPQARDALLRELPKGTARRIDDIGRVIDAIVRSNAKPLANPSGSAAGIIAALEDASLATRLYSGGSSLATTAAGEAIGTAFGSPGVVTAMRTAATASKKKKGPDVEAIRTADDLLASQMFKDAISEAVKGNTGKANKIAEDSPKFKRWAKTLTPAESQRLATLGFIGYLSQESNQEQSPVPRQ